MSEYVTLMKQLQLTCLALIQCEIFAEVDSPDIQVWGLFVSFFTDLSQWSHMEPRAEPLPSPGLALLCTVDHVQEIPLL